MEKSKYFQEYFLIEMGFLIYILDELDSKGGEIKDQIKVEILDKFKRIEEQSLDFDNKILKFSKHITLKEIEGVYSDFELCVEIIKENIYELKKIMILNIDNFKIKELDGIYSLI